VGCTTDWVCHPVRRKDTMGRVGRNDPCPCGSGRKFKKCHWGKEEGLPPPSSNDLSAEEMGLKIAALPGVEYGRSQTMAESLNLKEMTGRDIGIRFVDLKSYAALGFLGSDSHEGARGRGGGVFINPYKTGKADPDHLYLAVSPDIDDSTLIHELAHVLTYLGGAGHPPGTLDALGREFDVPVDHLEHTDEFGYWLDDLRRRFDAVLDADDTVILFLYQNGRLIKTAELDERNGTVLRAKSERIFSFLSQKSLELDAILRDLPGYIGPRNQGE
jgi:hypothetical protein